MSCDYIHFTLELNTDDFSYIVTGLERLHHYLDKKSFLSCDKITLNDACLVLGREEHLINVPICYFKYVTMNHVGNAIQVVADVVPFTTVMITIRMNSEEVPKKIALTNSREWFDVKYLKIDADIRTYIKQPQKRYSWWNK